MMRNASRAGVGAAQYGDQIAAPGRISVFTSTSGGPNIDQASKRKTSARAYWQDAREGRAGAQCNASGLSGRNLLDGLVEGRDPEHMVQGVKGKARKKIPALLDALGQGLDDDAKPLVALLRDNARRGRALVGGPGAADFRRGQARLRIAVDAAADPTGDGTAGRGRPAGGSGRRDGNVRYRPAG